MTFLSASRPTLMWIASSSRSPVTFDFLTFSQPPRSHRQSVDLTFPSPLAASCSKVSMISEWARDERSFISVAARRFAPSA